MNLSNHSRRDFLKTLCAGSLAMPAALLAAEERAAGKRPNVLFIAVDDLRPQLGCYGHKQMLSPNIDRLASQGVLFSRCYCQVPVCGASRASLLSGLRPTPERFLRYDTKVDEDASGALTLPRHFRDRGYHTVSNGKVFHHPTDDVDAWSERPWRTQWTPGSNWRNYLEEESIAIARENKGRGPAYEVGDVSDDAYFDGGIAKKSIADLKRLAKTDQPFFLAAGFLKPHLPFNAPRKYWDLYEREEIDLADNPFRPKGAPDAALHNWGELRNYWGIPQKGPLPDDLARTLVHGYYACVSYTDAQIGRLLDALERLHLRDDTVVVLWGDHGWNLGEHGLWCKHCNFETSLHSPLIVSAPGIPGGRNTDALTEFVDIYPSLCELCNLPLPGHLEGTSFVPLMHDPERAWKKAVFSRYGAGDSVKTDRYRYTEWRDKNGNVYARMLYDHKEDPLENVNIAEFTENGALVRQLSEMLEKGWRNARP